MDPLLALLSPPPSPLGLITIRGPLYVEPSSLELPPGMIIPHPAPVPITKLGPPISKEY